MGFYSVHLVGESHYQRAVAGLYVGEPVLLEHEPDNRHDKYAVRASTVMGDVIGYIERDHFVQRVVAREGKVVSARVEKIIGGERGKKSLGVILEVRTGSDLEDQASEIAEAAKRGGCAALLAVIALPILIFGGVAACSQASPKLSEVEHRAESAATAVRNQLRDPQSSQFRKVYVAGDVVCGEVNARNGFGGLAGFAPFIVAPGDVRIGVAGDINRSDIEFRTEIIRSCTEAIQSLGEGQFIETVSVRDATQ